MSDFNGFLDFDYDDGHDCAIDVCVNCGRYFEWSQHQAKLSRERFGETTPLEQQCIPCLRFVSPPQEY